MADMPAGWPNGSAIAAGLYTIKPDGEACLYRQNGLVGPDGLCDCYRFTDKQIDDDCSCDREQPHTRKDHRTFLASDIPAWRRNNPEPNARPVW